MSSPDVDHLAEIAAAESKDVRRDLRQTLLSGITLTIPFFITVLVLIWVLNAVSDALTPLVDLIEALGPTEGLSTVIIEAIAAALVLGFILLVGFAARHGPDTNLGTRIDTVMEDVPGVGTIYTSVERMSDVLVEGDTESFQDVKIVEFPTKDSFALAFLTANTPEVIETAADCGEMQTVFVPMAPNPVMGGHLINLPRDRIYDVDLSVEQGMEAIMTTGLAIDEEAMDDAPE